MDYALPENLPSLEDICKSHPVKLKLHVKYLFRELYSYPGIFLRLAGLWVICSIDHYGIDWLNDICKMSPNSTNVELLIYSGFGTFLDHRLIHSRSGSFVVDFLSESDTPLLSEI